MGDATADALDALARDGEVEAGPVELASSYLARVRRVESDPRNAPGADKSWVFEALESARRHYAAATRVSEP